MFEDSSFAWSVYYAEENKKIVEHLAFIFTALEIFWTVNNTLSRVKVRLDYMNVLFMNNHSILHISISTKLLQHINII